MARKKRLTWPNIYSRTNAAGSTSWMVDLGLINGFRSRKSFKSKAEAETYSEQAKIKRTNEGLEAFNLALEIRTDAVKANDLLKPHGVSLTDAAKYYLNHVVAYQSAPLLEKIVAQMVAEAESNKRRDRTVEDLKSRLEAFARAFPKAKLTEITLNDLKDWITDDDWAPQTKINYLTKVSQLYNYAKKHRWVEHNLVELIDRPDAEDKEPGILTVAQAESLLKHAGKFKLLPYISIGLFAGLRTTELLALKGTAIRLEDRAIVVGAEVAKKRSRRVVEMGDALVSWLTPLLPLNGKIVDEAHFRENSDALKKAAGIKEWPHNALRHSFGSYHLAHYGDQNKTAAQMGHRDATLVHNHYKALVMKSEAAKYWSLFLQSQNDPKPKGGGQKIRHQEGTGSTANKSENFG